MLVRRFYDDRLAQASYLVGCQQTGEAIVIDPARDIAPYLAAAEDEGVRITQVTETHIHADFMSGTRELAAATGALPLLSGEGGPDWQYAFATMDHATLLHDGDVIVLGNVRLRVMHTPGHTPEHLAFIVIDGARGPEPVAMVSGDFLFVGDVGRPDLLETAAGVTGSKEGSARVLYQSLQRLTPLPDYLQVWPGHGAGSACGKALGALPTSTLGYERRTNWAFQARDEAAFVTEILDGQPTPPGYFAIMKRINRDGPPVLGNRPLPPALADEALPGAMRDGMVVDIRPLNAYASAHVVGTLNIPLSKAFTKWAGWLLPHDRDLYLIAPDPDAAVQAERALQSIGLDRVRGVFGPATVSAAQASGMTGAIKRAPITESPTLQRAGTTIIDVRDTDEWEAGHIDGAVHRPLGNLPQSLAEMDRNTPVALHCAGGTRSAIGAALLEQMGFNDVTDLTGGWNAWTEERETKDERREK
jgi:hydroxyacylglutathione hydrolase